MGINIIFNYILLKKQKNLNNNKLILYNKININNIIIKHSLII